MAGIFECKMMRFGEECRGNMLLEVSRGERVLKCDKCDTEISIADSLAGKTNETK